ncbi:MAG: mechanosensitive ion channel domain-containing protein [Nanoarchaeota archaeon]
MRKLITLFTLIVITITLHQINTQHPIPHYDKYFFSLIAFIITHFLLKVVLEGIVIKRMGKSKARYNMKKIISILYVVILLLVITFIWVDDFRTLLVTYGIIGAGIAIAMQDVFKNFIGGIIIFLNKPYRVGDRIEITGKVGDVLDIGLLYTTLLEIREWVHGDQATGRMIKMPNSQAMLNSISNYTDDHEFIWDEITLPITYDSNWKQAKSLILDIVKKETGQIMDRAIGEIQKLEEKYYLGNRPTEPAIFINLTDNWITINVRYITETRNRRVIHNKISQDILEAVEKTKQIKIASQTISIVSFPGKKAK